MTSRGLIVALTLIGASGGVSASAHGLSVGGGGENIALAGNGAAAIPDSHLGEPVATITNSGAGVYLLEHPAIKRGHAAKGSTPKKTHVFDARYLRNLDLRDADQAAGVWDTMRVLAAVQKLANREAPQLHVIYCAELACFACTGRIDNRASSQLLFRLNPPGLGLLRPACQ